jgi:hypothetical protein
MTPAIGSSSAGMNGMGAALAGAPPMGDVPGGTGQPQLGAGPGMDAQSQMLQQFAQQVRGVSDQVKAMMAANPLVGDEAQQILQLLKQMIVKVAQPMPMANASGMAVPGGGGGA